jgi:integrase
MGLSPTPRLGATTSKHLRSGDIPDTLAPHWPGLVPRQRNPPRVLRHAYGSRLASGGLSARQIGDAMGHKKTSATETYIQRFNGEVADERVREAMSG